MRLTPLFVAFAALTPLSVSQAAEAPHDESVPHVHEEAKDPKDETPIDYFWRKSDEAFHAGDYPRAIGLHRAIVALDPTEIESYGVGAWLLWSLGQKDEAQKFLQEGVKANPKDPEMWDTAGQQYDVQKLTAESEQAYSKAIELSGKEASQLLRRRYAHSLEHAGNLAKAEETWSALVTDFPNDAVNKNNLARVQKQRAEAVKTGQAQNIAYVFGGAVLLGGLALLPLSKIKS